MAFLTANGKKLILAIALSLLPHVALGDLVSKVISKETVPGEPLGGLNKEHRRQLALARRLGGRGEDEVENISSNISMEIGACGPDTPFEFRIGAGSGRAVIGFSQEYTTFELQKDITEGSIEVVGPAEPNFFGVEAPEGFAPFFGAPIAFKDVPSGGALVTVTCSQEENQLISVVRDDSGPKVQAKVSFGASEGTQLLELADGLTSEETLKGYSKEKNANAKISFENATKKGITLKHNMPGGVALVQMKVSDDERDLHPRTLLVKARNKRQAVKELKFLSAKIKDEDGDVELKFRHIGNPNQAFLIQARISIEFDNGFTHDVVDVESIVRDGTLDVNNEWFRLAFENVGRVNQESGWDIKVDAIARDPNNGYRVVGVTDDKVPTGASRLEKSKRAKLVGARKFTEITEEMEKGHKPDKRMSEGSRNLRPGRELSGAHKKILVHGYCGTKGKWPLNDFTDYIEFEDTSSPDSWSHDQFATKIDTFADNNNIHGCACIAHSQGGAACLHLYTYYWSCLDYSEPSSGSRMIQSVGTPYQGTALAGSLAIIGEIFGAGCGSNLDLTYNGASSWLSGIPNWARSKVHYYTSSFEDKWWRYDYCHLATDLFLDDPEDGTTEKWSGQLSGGNNRGHKTRQCHSDNMRDPPQYKDSSRNNDMNYNAKY